MDTDPRPEPQPEVIVVAYRTAAVILFVANIPSVAYVLLNRGAWAAIFQLAFGLFFAIPLFAVRRRWATAFFRLTLFSAVYITWHDFRGGASLRSALSATHSWAFTASMLLLLQGSPSRRRIVAAALIFGLIATPAAVCARLLH